MKLITKLLEKNVQNYVSSCLNINTLLYIISKKLHMHRFTSSLVF